MIISSKLRLRIQGLLHSIKKAVGNFTVAGQGGKLQLSHRKNYIKWLSQSRLSLTFIKGSSACYFGCFGLWWNSSLNDKVGTAKYPIAPRASYISMISKPKKKKRISYFLLFMIATLTMLAHFSHVYNALVYATSISSFVLLSYWFNAFLNIVHRMSLFLYIYTLFQFVNNSCSKCFQ